MKKALSSEFSGRGSETRILIGAPTNPPMVVDQTRLMLFRLRFSDVMTGNTCFVVCCRGFSNTDECGKTRSLRFSYEDLGNRTFSTTDLCHHVAQPLLFALVSVNLHNPTTSSRASSRHCSCPMSVCTGHLLPIPMGGIIDDDPTRHESLKMA